MSETTTAGKPWDEIRSIVEVRRAERSPLIARMSEIRSRYNADYVIIDPTSQTDDVSSALTPAIINEAIDQPALRAASVTPNLFVPALEPHKVEGKNSEQYADITRAALQATWGESHLNLQLRKAFRHLRAYATCAMVVEPDYRAMMPRIALRDPLTALPEPKAQEDMTLPSNAAFIYSKSADAIRAMFPASRAEAGGPIAHDANQGEMWDLVEWIDEEVIVYGLLGPRLIQGARSGSTYAMQQTDPARELARFPNYAGCCPVVMPQAITLDTVMSQIGQIIGHMDLAAQLFMLEIQAVKTSIFPDRYIIGNQMGAPSIVGGTWKDGSTGEVNLLENVQSVGELRGNPDPTVERMQDRLERNARVTSGSVSQFSGESGGQAMRTGRGIDTMGAWAVDSRVQELQEVMEVALERINEATIETYKGCFKRKKFHLMNGRKFVEFTPAVHFGDGRTKVSYAIAGADKQGTTIILGQQLGMKLISHRTARELHPDIADPEAERRQILEESLDEALMVSILQRSSAPDIPGAIAPEDGAKIRKYIREGLTLDEAVLKVNQERQEIQAAQAEAMQAQAGAEPMMDPAAMQPGMAGPNEGVSPGLGLAGGPGQMTPTEAPGFGQTGPPADLDRMRMLANALRSPARQ